MKKHSSIIIVLLFLSIIGMPSFVSADGENWLTGWTYRIEYTVDNNVGGESIGPNYQVFVNTTYRAGMMQTDFDDIVFTDNDGETPLDHWLMKKIDSSYAEFWVEVADEIFGIGSIYMYFGMAEASSVSNGPATFLLFDDFNDASLNTSKWDVISGSVTESGGYLYQNDGAEHSQVASVDGFEAGVALHTLTYREDSRIFGFMEVTASTPNYSGDCAYYVQNIDEVVTENEGVATTTGSVTQAATTWEIYQVRWISSIRVVFYIDGVEKAEHTTNVPDETQRFYGYVNKDDTTPERRHDWIFVRLCAETEPTITPILIGDWQTAGDAEFIFPVGWDPTFQFGYDAVFIFLGLIMIPLSMMFLVRGGKEDLSSDKFFYFLIMFVMGWALFVGGIMP